MQLYKFDKEKLEYRKVNYIKWIVLVVSFFILLLIFFAQKEVKIKIVSGETEVNLRTDEDVFSKEKLIQEMKRLKIKHPSIVYSQFVLESNHFRSPLFKNHSNMMGMKIATTRATTSVGSENGYSIFNNWRDGILDYALYQSSFLRGLNEQEYYQYLSQHYAEDKEYVNKLKNYIKTHHVKQQFN